MEYTTILYGKNLCNMLANVVIEEYKNIEDNNISEISVTNTGNFLILNGKTTIKKVLNFSPIFSEYIFSIYGTEINFNVIDLINYDYSFDDVDLFLDINLSLDENFVVLDVSSMKSQGFLKVYDSLNKIVTNNISLYEEISHKLVKDYSIVKIDELNCFISDRFFGLSLNKEKVYTTYLKYIFYHLTEKYLCKNINFKLHYTGNIKNITWENMDFKVESSDNRVSIEWIESLILDIFNFNYVQIINDLDLTKYNFINEINGDVCWKKRDRIGEMITL